MTTVRLQTSPDTSKLDTSNLAKVAEFAAKFDHTNLHPTSGKDDIANLCNEATKYGFATVCIAPRWVPLAAELLSRQPGNTVRVCTVVGFPHGNITTEGKVFEATHAIATGASEIDMVISLGDLKDRSQEVVEQDIAAVVDAAHEHEAIVKVILETAYLKNDEITLGCQLSVKARADYVKTSTGFGPKGADINTVRLMRQTVPDAVGVKAAGGIRTFADARSMLDAGVSRIGSSSTVQIINEFINRLAP